LVGNCCFGCDEGLSMSAADDNVWETYLE
jgi:hypothetical protein